MRILSYKKYECNLLKLGTHTLGQISLLRAVSAYNETTLISCSMGGSGEWSHTCTYVRDIFVMPLGSKYADL